MAASATHHIIARRKGVGLLSLPVMASRSRKSSIGPLIAPTPARARGGHSSVIVASRQSVRLYRGAALLGHEHNHLSPHVCLSRQPGSFEYVSPECPHSISAAARGNGHCTGTLVYSSRSVHGPPFHRRFAAPLHHPGVQNVPDEAQYCGLARMIMHSLTEARVSLPGEHPPGRR